MKFRTELTIEPLEKRIDHRSKILMMGSCFSDNIGAKLQDYLFNISVNPFGVTYNPLSISRCIDMLVEKKCYEEQDLDFFNELWFSFDHYTLFSDIDKQQALNKINIDFRIAKQLLQQLDFLVLTFGTAWVYSKKTDGQIVNNCHKIPARDFDRRSLAVEEIVEKYTAHISAMLEKRPEMQVILTVSPVRHIKDGLVGNQRSKAALVLACRELEAAYPGNCHYFPSYEIMMDDLRDYRFYNADMTHPNSMAVEYIWQKFSDYCISGESHKICEDLDPVLKAVSHKPVHRDTEVYRKFKENTEKKLRAMKNKYPFVDWDRVW